LALLIDTKKIRCLQIIPSLGFGGVETGVKNTHQYLIKTKQISYILCEKIFDNHFKDNPFIIQTGNLSFKNPFHYFRIKSILLKVIFKNKINVVHISSRAPSFFYSSLIKKYKGIKLVTSFHNEYQQNNFLKSYYNRSLLKGDVLICNSHFVKKSILDNYKTNKKIEVIERGIDTNYFKTSKIKSINTKLPIYILNPSRVSSWKGHIQLLQNFLIIQKSLDLKIIFLFISSHINKHELELDSFINKNKIDKSVQFLSPSNDIKKYYLKSHLVINYSIRPEGFGRTISEALSMNIPAIAPNYGGTKEQLLKFNKKLLFQINSHSSLEKTLRYAIANHKEIALKARKYVSDNYSLERMMKKTINAYQK